MGQNINTLELEIGQLKTQIASMSTSASLEPDQIIATMEDLNNHHVIEEVRKYAQQHLKLLTPDKKYRCKKLKIEHDNDIGDTMKVRSSSRNKIKSGDYICDYPAVLVDYGSDLSIEGIENFESL